jgi:ABC-type polar amino acid transport system ATPase subunit
VIIVKDLYKSFEDNQVLKGVSYHIHSGEKIVDNFKNAAIVPIRIPRSAAKKETSKVTPRPFR